MATSLIWIGLVCRATNRGRSASASEQSGGLHLPPEAVAAGQAARRHAAVSQRAVEALPGGECGGALVRLVLVM